MRLKMMIVLTLIATLLCASLALAADDAYLTDPAALAAESGMPVLSITTHSGDLPGEEDERAMLTRYVMREGGMHVQSMHIEINVRGNTSKRFPKKSYRVKITDSRGDKQNYALIDGFRSDDDWILNPMYTDTSKIREALSYEIWDMMNSSGMVAASSRVAYAEVYINGEYWGLYGVQERIDRKQVGGDKRFSVLYKVYANHRPTVNELLLCEDDEICRGLEMSYTGERIMDPWLPAASYMAMLNGEENPGDAKLSQANTIDYGLFAMVTQAHDCHFKNQYMHGVSTANGYTLYRMPWDLNNTLGDIYQNDREDINYTNFAVCDLVMDGAFRVLVETGGSDVHDAVRARWRELRASTLTYDNLIARAYALFEPLAGAMERDSRRWPMCGMGNGNAVNIRDIESFLREILPMVDAWVENLGSDQEWM